MDSPQSYGAQGWGIGGHKKVDHYKKIEKKRGYEGKSLKMDPRWVKAFQKNDKWL